MALVFRVLPGRSVSDNCLDQSISRDDYRKYTRTITQLCQAKKDRYDKKDRKERETGDGRAGAMSVKALRAEINSLRNALQSATQNRNGSATDNKQKRPCPRCLKFHEGGREKCKAPPIVCPFVFPDGTKCKGDHHIDMCWGKHPEKCSNPKIRAAIERKLAKKGNATKRFERKKTAKTKANRAEADSDSESDTEAEQVESRYTAIKLRSKNKNWGDTYHNWWGLPCLAQGRT